MRAFCAIVESRSLSAAAERLQTTHSTLSRQLQQLEGALGACLIQRTTRQLGLTPAGEAYYRACVDIIGRVDAADQSVTGLAGIPSGALRVSAPLVMGTLELGSWLPAWQAAYSRVELDLTCSDQFVDLVADGIDVALRITPELADTTLMARRLTTTDQVLVASVAYVARRGLPRTPSDLSAHALLGFGGRAWTLQDEGGVAEIVNPGKTFRSDAITALHAAVLLGLGIGVFTLPTVRVDLQSGRLVRILPGFTAGRRHYYALYPQTRHLPAQARAFIDFMAEHYAH